MSKDYLKIKKKHGIALSEEIYHLTIPKDENDKVEGEKEYYECYLREPTLAEEENLLPQLERIYTATQKALQALFLEGDECIMHEKRLIKASVVLINDIFNTKSAILEKK